MRRSKKRTAEEEEAKKGETAEAAPAKERGFRSRRWLLRWLAALVLTCLAARAILQSKYDSSNDPLEDSTLERDGEDYEDSDPECRERMRRRMELLERVCREDPEAEHLRSEDNFPDPHFFRSNAEHRATVCTPHKCGSESWRYFFEKLDERDRNSSEWRSAILKEWPEDVGSFVKGFQVRHPMERVISSYRYVFEQTTLYLTDDLALRILQRFAGHPVQDGKGKVFPNRTVTFREFVRFLGSQRLFPESLTERSASSHWRPFHLQCNPCHPGFRPDFLLHLETSAEDALCFLDRVQGLEEEDYGNLYVVNRHPEAHSSDGGVRRRMFSQLSRGDVERVAEFYGLDMRMHGYDLEEYLSLATAEEIADDESLPLP